MDPDSFFMSNALNANDNDIGEWIKKSEWKLPIPISHCGPIIYKHWVFIFGGGTVGCKFLDEIYVLDLESDDGWKKLKHIKCPIPSKYIGLVVDHHVHLFTYINQWPNWQDSLTIHYTIPISTLLGSKFVC